MVAGAILNIVSHAVASRWRELGRAFALLLGIAVVSFAGVSSAQEPPPQPKFHSPFNGDKEPGSGEQADLNNLVKLREQEYAAEAKLDAAKKCGTKEDIEKAEAASETAWRASSVALEQYVRDWSTNVYPHGAPNTWPQASNNRFRADMLAVISAVDRLAIRPAAPTACPPKEQPVTPPAPKETPPPKDGQPPPTPPKREEPPPTEVEPPPLPKPDVPCPGGKASFHSPFNGEKDLNSDEGRAFDALVQKYRAMAEANRDAKRAEDEHSPDAPKLRDRARQLSGDLDSSVDK
jgi:hypothetical protein